MPSFFFTSSNNDSTMTEQLRYVVEGTASCRTSTRRQDKLWPIYRSTSSSESSSTCLFPYFRPRFLLVGILFGAFMELVYVQSVQLGFVKLEQPAADNKNDHRTDIFFVELSFLYSSDVVFLLFTILLYIIALARSALKKNLSLSLPLMAANWLVGMVLGLLVAMACLFGPKSLTRQQILQLLVIMIVGIALCFVTYSTAMAMVQMHKSGKVSSSYTCEESKTEQESQSVLDLLPTSTTTTSLPEQAHIV